MPSRPNEETRPVRVLAIGTDFAHHGEDSGYKQILKFIRPVRFIGINERSGEKPPSFLHLKYQWLFEFSARKYRREADVIHVMYGEDYLRFSPGLFGGKPVIATFHQPAEVLEREISLGDLRGRAGRLTHLLTPGRFRRLAAAIVTNQSQKEVLKKVMPEDKIFVIPLGIHLGRLAERFDQDIISRKNPRKGEIITVGNWLRDWDFYFKTAGSAPGLTFVLINQSLPPEFREKAERLPNVTYLQGVTDEELEQRILDASVSFLPVTGIAGSNALAQTMALGCPVVLTDVNPGIFAESGGGISLYQPGNVEDAIARMNTILTLPEDEQQELRLRAHLFTHRFSWESVAEKTLEIYRKVL